MLLSNTYINNFSGLRKNNLFLLEYTVQKKTNFGVATDFYNIIFTRLNKLRYSLHSDSLALLTNGQNLITIRILKLGIEK